MPNPLDLLCQCQAIAYVDFDAVVYVQSKLHEVEESGVRVFFQVTRANQESTWPESQSFIGKEAENLRAGLSKALGANRFS
ncbi:MAG: hypothetical protein V7L23_25575 [Nostoc sp.]|uniref:hypothetical protein n=1 Tax=Nostoc sp. TaxID=1180 RepID=UPI002FF273AC